MTKARDISYIALAAALMALCAWISIPAAVPVTLQTLGVFLAAGLLGGRRGAIAVGVYILMAAMGLPVLAGFSGGAGILLGSRGGYILGFLLIALVMWAAEKLPGDPRVTLICSMAAGLALCYAFGTVWFMALYTKSHGPVALGTVLGWCVFPFLLPDAAKIAGAAVLIRRLKRHIR